MIEVGEGASLVETLSGDGPFTISAPTDDAFAQFPDGKLDGLQQPENKETLAEILTFRGISDKTLDWLVISMAIKTVVFDRFFQSIIVRQTIGDDVRPHPSS